MESPDQIRALAHDGRLEMIALFLLSSVSVNRTAAAVFLLKVIRGEDYTHAEIARVLGRSPEEIDQVERDCRQQFEVGKWRELIRGIKERIDDAGGRLL